MGGMYVFRTKFFGLFLLITSLFMSMGYATINSRTLTVEGIITITKESSYEASNSLSKISIGKVDGVESNVVYEEDLYYFEINVKSALQNVGDSVTVPITLYNDSDSSVMFVKQNYIVSNAVDYDAMIYIDSTGTTIIANSNYETIVVITMISVPEVLEDLLITFEVDIYDCAEKGDGRCNPPVN